MAKDTRSQRERMLAGDLYLADDPQLLQESRRAGLDGAGGAWPADRRPTSERGARRRLA